MLPHVCLSQRLIAKSAQDGSHQWLPLQTHLSDTGEIALRLWDLWIPEAVRQRIALGCDGKSARQILHFIALTHDVGKATPDFQQKILQGMSRSNADAGQEARELLEGVLEAPMSPLTEHLPHGLMSQGIALANECNDAVASILGAHHGKASGTMTQLKHLRIHSHDENMVGCQTSQWKETQRSLIAWALQQSGYSSVAELPAPDQSALVLLTGLLIIADWMASNSRWFPYIAIRETEPPESSAERAARAWSMAKLPQPWSSDADAFEHVAWLFDIARYGFDTPNPMQLAVLETISQTVSPGIFILESGMGSGKTEAALAGAELLAAKTKRSGVFFALPTQATSNGIFPRLKKWSEAISREASQRHSIRLVHGAAHLNAAYRGDDEQHANICEDDEQPGVSIHAWFEGGKKALLADFVVGTVDQLLMAALSRKHVMLRHVGLAGKIVIIDECHAYDTYMNQYLERALAWLSSYRVPVIILSATLPAARRSALLRAYVGKNASFDSAMMTTKHYPLLTWSDAGTIQQCFLPAEQSAGRVQIEPLPYDDLYAAVGRIMEHGGCLGIVMNTVKAAQELTKQLQATYPEGNIQLLHSRFVMADRIKKEQQLIDCLGKKAGAEERPKWCITVGTQVIEQSLDIDFDVMITELCPMDLLLQRIGRLHRHACHQRPGAHQAPRCYVLGAKEALSESNQAVYGAWLLLRTQAELPSEITLPRDIPWLVQRVYDEPENMDSHAAEWKEAWEEYRNEQALQAQRAKVFLLKLPKRTDAGKSRIATLNDWQHVEYDSKEQYAEAAVRDASATLEVLALRQDANGIWHYLGDEHCIPRELTRDIAAQIAGQRLRLPSALCAERGNRRNVSLSIIEQLEQETLRQAPDWQQFALLKGELLLRFDENGKACLNGYTLQYDSRLGLCYEKEGNDGNALQPH